MRRIFWLLPLLMFAVEVVAAPYLVYPASEPAFEAISVEQTADSIRALTSQGLRCYAWRDVLEVLQPDGQPLIRSIMAPVEGKRGVTVEPGLPPVRLESRKERPYQLWVYPGVVLLGSGIGVAAASAKYFRDANQREELGEDPSALRKDGEFRRTAGLAMAFSGAAMIVIALTPKATLKPVFTWNQTTNPELTLRYEISLLGILD